MSSDKRCRRSNFSEQELTVLTDEVSANHDVLFAPFSPIVTNKRKTDLWEIIAEKVSAVGSSKRNGSDVRKKWNELKCQIRKKEQTRKRELSKTGGGPAPNPLSNLENKFQTVVDLEREKLQVLHEMLDIERKRLAIEERRQAVEEKRLAIDEEMFILMKNKSLSSPFTLSPIIKFT
ncbi:myb/SANT-like DNA-binding domain-containing protein 4 [Haliotis cracherodii]|uniref:myb/SANT-like DNA-binding domain-containing protein 4 n=1 Tax=Haliotis cracherodii TaxID=6455 RepID=UPI0039E7A855